MDLFKNFVMSLKSILITFGPKKVFLQKTSSLEGGILKIHQEFPGGMITNIFIFQRPYQLHHSAIDPGVNNFEA